jgi:hypothetical protein
MRIGYFSDNAKSIERNYQGHEPTTVSKTHPFSSSGNQVLLGEGAPARVMDPTVFCLRSCLLLPTFSLPSVPL